MSKNNEKFKTGMYLFRSIILKYTGVAKSENQSNVNFLNILFFRIYTQIYSYIYVLFFIINAQANSILKLYKYWGEG